MIEPKLRPHLVRVERPVLSEEERKKQVADLCITAEFLMLRRKRDRAVKLAA